MTASSWSPLHFTEAFGVTQPKETSFPLGAQVDPSAPQAHRAIALPCWSGNLLPTRLRQWHMARRSHRGSSSITPSPVGPKRRMTRGPSRGSCAFSHIAPGVNDPPHTSLCSFPHFSLLIPTQSSGFDLEVTRSRKPLPSEVWDRRPSLCFHKPRHGIHHTGAETAMQVGQSVIPNSW